jgi:hypothetical protein
MSGGGYLQQSFVRRQCQVEPQPGTIVKFNRGNSQTFWKRTTELARLADCLTKVPLNRFKFDRVSPERRTAEFPSDETSDLGRPRGAVPGPACGKET